jgi:hypothetical protein
MRSGQNKKSQVHFRSLDKKKSQLYFFLVIFCYNFFLIDPVRYTMKHGAYQKMWFGRPRHLILMDFDHDLWDLWVSRLNSHFHQNDSFWRWPPFFRVSLSLGNCEQIRQIWFRILTSISILHDMWEITICRSRHVCVSMWFIVHGYGGFYSKTYEKT